MNNHRRCDDPNFICEHTEKETEIVSNFELVSLMTDDWWLNPGAVGNKITRKIRAYHGM